MKKIQAYIKKHKFNSVKIELNKVTNHGGISGLSVYEVIGHGKGRAINVKDSITYEMHRFVNHLCIEIVCNDEICKEVTNAIQTAAHTGRSGDGKIFISTIENAIRISDGKQGDCIV